MTGNLRDNIEGFDHPNTPKPPCAVLQRSPCVGCLQLGDLDREILEVKSHLEALELIASRKALLIKVNEEHDPIGRRLPLELATYIFSLSILFQPSLEVFSEFGGADCIRRKAESVPFILGAVCRTWRTIVSSTPHLWNIVPVTLTRRSSPAKRDLLEQWLARSGNCPLFVRVVSLPLDRLDSPAPATVRLLTDILATLRPFSRRFRVLYLIVPPMNMSPLRLSNPTSLPRATDAAPAMALDNIKVRVGAAFSDILHESAVFDLGFVPAPRTLTIHGVYWRNVKVDVTNITQLSLSRCAIIDIAEILQQIPLLRSLCVSFIVGDFIDFTTLQAIDVVHHGLQNLDVYMEGLIDSVFFDFVSLPSLQRLSCDLNGTHLDELISCLRRSKCPLKSLDLLYIDRDVDALFELLHLTPSLTRLRIFGTIIQDDFFMMMHSDARIDEDVDFLLPHLNTLVLQNVGGFEWSSIPLLFPSAKLLEQGGAFRRISEVEVVMEDEDYIDKETVERILDLRKTAKISIVHTAGKNLLLSSMELHGMIGDSTDDTADAAESTEEVFS